MTEKTRKLYNGSLHDGLPPKEARERQKAREVAQKAKVRERRVKVIDFDEDEWVTLEFTRDDGTRDRAVFKLNAWCGLTAERLEQFNAAQRRGPRFVIGPKPLGVPREAQRRP